MQDRYRGVVLKVQGILPKARWARLATALAGLLMLSFAFAQPVARPKREVTLTAQSVPLSVADATLDHVGSLRYLGGLWLRSEDPGFGGISGLSVREQGGALRIIGITDDGSVLSGRLLMSEGRLRGIESVTLEPLANLDGTPLAGKAAGDAESMALLPDGRVLIGFEQRHRLWAYGPDLAGPARVFETPPTLAQAPRNGGLESVGAWPDGRVLAITEQAKTERGNFMAFLSQNGVWASLDWTGSAPGFEPSDAAVLPDGDLLVLERFWSALAPLDLRSRIMRVKGDSVRAGAVLQGDLVAEFRSPLIFENFEALAAWPAADGSARLLLASDNNFNRAQRTLLLEFAMEAKARP